MVQRSAYDEQLFRSRMPLERQIQSLHVRVAVNESGRSRLRDNVPTNGPFVREYDRHTRKKVVPVLEKKIKRFVDPRDDDVQPPAGILLPQVFAQESALVLAGEPVRLQVFGIIFDAFRRGGIQSVLQGSVELTIGGIRAVIPVHDE